MKTAMLLFFVALVVTCNVPFLEEEKEKEPEVPNEASMETVMVLIAIPRAVVESEEDDPMLDQYPSGMTLSGSTTAGITATLTNCAPYSGSSITVSGSITLTGSDSGDRYTIGVNGSVTFSGAPHTTGSVAVELVFPSDGAGGPDMDADFLETNGTITLDGDSWAFGDTLEAMEAYTESEGLEEPTYPYRAHFVAVGPAADSRGPTIRYSRNGEEWGTIHAPGEAELFSVAANDAGNLVAVGADRWWGIPDGRGYIYYSDRGETWEPVETLDTGLGLYRVVYAENRWVAVGNGGALYYSADGRSWTAGDTGTTRFLHAVAYGGGVWMVAGVNGLWAQASEIDGNWTIGSATVIDESDPMAMPMEPSIRGVVYDSSSTYGWTAVAYALEKIILLDLNPTSMEAEEIPDFADELGSLVQGEPKRYIRWSDSGTTHHYILCQTDGAPRLLSKSTASWASEQFATTGSAHLADIAGGPSTSGGSPRLLLISASGDAWLSYDRGGSWTQVLADSYGTHGVTYRSW